MSEYQYYEFQAIDRPLTEREMSELRALSTRAHITPVSFTNEYHWGDFKGDPEKLMQRYFDAHVYVANWRTAIFMVRVPKDALTEETIKAVTVPHILDIKTTKTHRIIIWCMEESEDDDRFGMEDGHSWMSRLAPVREELLRGDLRSLYIGWLASVDEEMLDDDEMEPVTGSGLNNLTPAQLALAEFLDVDEYLLTGAGMGGPAVPEVEFLRTQMDAWIDTLPRNEVNAILAQLIEGKGQQVERSVKNRFASWQRNLATDTTEKPRRTVGELRNNAEKARQISLEKQKRDRELLEINNRKKREAFLKNLSTDFPKAWRSVQKSIERGSGQGYDEASIKLVDISEAYALFATRKQFQIELNQFMADHMRRKSLIQRLVKAGIRIGK